MGIVSIVLWTNTRNWRGGRSRFGSCLCTKEWAGELGRRRGRKTQFYAEPGKSGRSKNDESQPLPRDFQTRRPSAPALKNLHTQRGKLPNVNILYGINTVTEALKARGRNFEWIGVAKERKDIRLRRVIDECRKIGVPVRVLSREELDEIAGTAAHQGLVAATSAKQYSDLDDIVASRRGEHSLIVVLDGVEDPHNLGAILRTADAAGADGVVIPERRSAAVTAAVAKVSAGASEHLPVAKVTNISRALEELKGKDLWVVGLDERSQQTYDAVDYKMHCAIVLGAEGKGLHDLVRRHCDFLVSIPMLGKVPSLNVSVAAGVVLYEVVRQRRLASEHDASGNGASNNSPFKNDASKQS